MPDLCELVTKAIVDTPLAKIDEGGFVRAGFSQKLDEYRAAEAFGTEWLAKLEQTEREETKIKELKISFNRVTGYYFEVPSKYSDRVPYRYQRKGSTVNADRFTTDELKGMELKILGAHESAIELEQQILGELRGEVMKRVAELKDSSAAIAMLDVLASFALVAVERGFVRPKLNREGRIVLKNARHPVVERIVGAANFIANDCEVRNSTMMITGPNMAGKSTFMRMVAAVVLMAHVGSFVPAEFADVAITDRIFTRIGASDSLATGESTFMVEMNEVSNIVHNATKASLILLDEVGRGTGTADGRALASAILSFITDKIGANTLFATHFHELTNLAKTNPKIHNYKVLTEEIGGEIVFLHKVAPGIEENSFGIEVARLAGLPKEIIEAAKKIF
jgi:DNA mismatch repair protein MutS